MTVNRQPCRDYDPDYKLHGCELGAHAADKPHRDLLGNEWRESLQVPCPSISDEGTDCTLHFGHHPARHRDASGSEWTDEIYRNSGPRKPAPATYEGQLQARVAELIPGLDASERLELACAMDADDMRGVMAFLATLYPDVFDRALVSNRAMLDRLIGSMR